MKRTICTILVILLLLSLLPTGTMAAEKSDQIATYIYFDDGSFLRVSISENATSQRVLKTVTGSKKYEYHDSSGKLCWVATLRASFTYDGVNSVCTASNCDVTLYDSDYYLGSKTASRQGNCAYGSVNIGVIFLGVTFPATNYQLSMSCDKNGTLS